MFALTSGVRAGGGIGDLLSEKRLVNWTDHAGARVVSPSISSSPIKTELIPFWVDRVAKSDFGPDAAFGFNSHLGPESQQTSHFGLHSDFGPVSEFGSKI